MNAISPMPPPHLDAWSEATRRVNAWRGEVIHWFTFTELAVSKALLELTNGKKLARMVGPRFKTLATMLNGDHAEELSAFAPLLDDRIALCHGASKISIDRNGAWLVRLKWLEFGSEAIARERIWDETEAAAYLLQLKERGTRLVSLLNNLNKSKPV